MPNINVYVVTIEQLDGGRRYHIGLRHDDGRAEVSDQSWATEKECEQAIEQYADEMGEMVQRRDRLQ